MSNTHTNRSDPPRWEPDDYLVEWFDALANPHRQFVLSYLATQSDTVSVDELTERMAAWSDEPVSAIGLSLYHRHLPKLADGDLIRYDAEAGAVWRTESTERLVGVLDQLRVTSEE